MAVLVSRFVALLAYCLLKACRALHRVLLRPVGMRSGAVDVRCIHAARPVRDLQEARGQLLDRALVLEVVGQPSLVLVTQTGAERRTWLAALFSGPFKYPVFGFVACAHGCIHPVDRLENGVGSQAANNNDMHFSMSFCHRMPHSLNRVYSVLPAAHGRAVAAPLPSWTTASWCSCEGYVTAEGVIFTIGLEKGKEDQFLPELLRELREPSTDCPR